MAKKVVFLLDRTGSMSSIKQATIEGYNAYLAGLPASVQVARIQFDDIVDPTMRRPRMDFDVVHGFMKKAQMLDDATFIPRGSTPLYDAIASAIHWTEEHVSPKDDVLLVILTDGQENASREYTLPTVNALMKQKEDEDGWTFMYIGAGKEAWGAEVMRGTQSASNVYRSAGYGGTRAMFAAATASTRAYSAAPSGQTVTVVDADDAARVQEVSD